MPFYAKLKYLVRLLLFPMMKLSAPASDSDVTVTSGSLPSSAAVEKGARRRSQLLSIVSKSSAMVPPLHQALPAVALLLAPSPAVAFVYGVPRMKSAWFGGTELASSCGDPCGDMSGGLDLGDGLDTPYIVDEVEEVPEVELIPGVDYEIPDHEQYRTSRRTPNDETCDRWFGALLNHPNGFLGPLASDARSQLTTPVPLVNEVELPYDHEDWTPFVSTKLPWTPLTPAYGLEEFGLPVPRKNAEAWRQFELMRMVKTNFTALPEGNGLDIFLSDDKVREFQQRLNEKGAWLTDDECQARLVYINGRFAPQLSITNEIANNLHGLENVSEEVISWLSRVTDGFTDELAATTIHCDKGIELNSHKKLSGPDHSMGEPTSQFAINVQHGTACFTALNTMLTGSVAYIHTKEGEVSDKPVMLVNVITKNAGAEDGADSVAFHPRCLVATEARSALSFIQTSVDLDTDEKPIPRFYNGYTQFFVKEDSNLTHTILEESGGTVTPLVERNDGDFAKGEPKARVVEAARPEMKDIHFETIDAHIVGDRGSYEGALVSLGGSGHTRFGVTISLLKPESRAKLYGFAMAGGLQSLEMKSTIHHIAKETYSEQLQKNMVGGRATTSFRGRLRVEQSAQQTNGDQLSRSILLSDKCTAWAVPSLEVIADDVKCTHGATVSDLAEEEAFYLLARGIDHEAARTLLMYAFAREVGDEVNPILQKKMPDGSDGGLRGRIRDRMQNIIPQGDQTETADFSNV
eukprot:Nitzschia sp. Nitz4//scaffold86_size83305//33503//35834//NITZ4_005256-RA/size83305-snap-gene-0.166-mRNA-1//-1//CDS//3329559232//9476//frame0